MYFNTAEMHVVAVVIAEQTAVVAYDEEQRTLAVLSTRVIAVLLWQTTVKLNQI